MKSYKSNTVSLRRPTVSVKVGRDTFAKYIGSEYPVLVQSMTDTSTLDIEGSAAQCIALANAGADMVRLTAQGVKQAEAIGEIHRIIRDKGCDIPLSADIHFNTSAAFAAAETADKVRINPGNFVDPGRVFKIIDYDDKSYSEELTRLEEKFTPLIELCRKRGVALRIGVNHGSLSDRIMSRYGDTPEGIVESAMEFLRICKANDFKDVVVSVKASNVLVMVSTVRMLVKAMHEEGMSYPMHLGVTEAGDGDMARIKSAIGIGSLLADGIGDTIRVSLSENPVNEIPAAKTLIKHVESISQYAATPDMWLRYYDISRKNSVTTPLVVGYDINPEDITVDAEIVQGNLYSMREVLESKDRKNIFTVLKAAYPSGLTKEEFLTAVSVDLGSLVLEGYGDALWVTNPDFERDYINEVCLLVLQACRRRISQTEYIACPGCGRTLFDLRSALEKVKTATAGHPGLKIAVMGCVVNGPGEMADADYGYVGAGIGKVSVYKGKQCVHKNVDPEEALDLLLALIAENNEKNKE